VVLTISAIWLVSSWASFRPIRLGLTTVPVEDRVVTTFDLLHPTVDFADAPAPQGGELRIRSMRMNVQP
jgi:hypothetical protein